MKPYKNNIASSLLRFWFVWPAVGFVLLATAKYGAGIDSDGINYMLFGKTLAHTGDLMNYDNALKGLWPPLFPAIIALFDILRFNIIQAIRFFDALLFLFTLVFTYLILDSSVRNKKLVFAGIVILLFSFPVFSLFTKVLSDTSFIFLTTAIIYLITLLENKWDNRYFYWLIVCMALIPIQRYAGIFTNVIAVVFLIWVNRKNIPILKKLISGTAIAAIPIVLWLARNYFTVHDLTTANPRMDLGRLFISGREAFGDWILPGVLPSIYKGIVFFLVLITACLIVIKEKISFKGVQFLPFFFLGYFALLTLTIPYSKMEYRYLSPAFIPFLASLCIIGDQLKPHRLKTLTILCLACMAITQIVTTSLFIAFRFQNGGGGYNTQEWQNSALANRLEEEHLNGTVYTNQLAACQYFNDNYAILINNDFLEPNSQAKPQGLSNKGYLVLFNDTKRDITEMDHFLPLKLNPIINKSLQKESDTSGLILGLPQDIFLQKFAKANSITYLNPEIFSDGSIYPFIKTTTTPSTKQ